MSYIPNQEIKSVLAGLLRHPVKSVEKRTNGKDTGADLLIKSDPWQFVIEFRTQAFTDRIKEAAARLEAYRSRGSKQSIPLLVVPYMGNAGRELCRQFGMSWLDLAGNADIEAPGLAIRVSGRPNPHVRRGRPSSAFAPKSARVARTLLLQFPKWVTQKEIAQASDLSEGFVSQIVRRLKADELVVRNDHRAFRPRDPNTLLDRWSEEYDFTKHVIIRGHFAARSGNETLIAMAKALENARAEFAATGLAGAWQYSQFAAFRQVTIYLKQEPTRKLLEDAGLRLDSESPNVWLVIPNDEGVFQGTTVRDGVPCVHPLQVYLDLKGHAERAPEAAQRLREEHLIWRVSGQ